MTDPTERDPALGGAIDALPVPDHNDGFWGDLRTGLRAGVDGAERSSEPIDDAPGAGAPGRDGTVIDIEVPLRRPRWRRFGRPLPLLAAACVVVVVASLVDLRSGLDDSGVDAGNGGPSATIGKATPSTARSFTARTSTAPSSTAAPVSGSVAVGDGNLELVPGSEVGGFSGLFAAFLPGGSTALVSEEDGEVPSECGASTLYAVDLASGDRTRVESPGARLSVTDVNGAGETVGPIECEMVVSGITVARWGADGSLLSAREITGDLFPRAPDFSGIDFLRTLHWGSDGSLLVATGTGAYQLPVTDGLAPVDLGVGPALWVDRDAAGRTAAVLTSGEVVLDGEVIATVTVRDDFAQEFGDGAMMGITGIRADTEGAVWVASATDGVVRIGPGQEPVQLDPDPAAALVPTGGGMLWITGDPAGDGPFTTRGLVEGAPTDLVSYPVLAGDTGGTRLAGSVPEFGSDGSVSFMTTVMDVRPVP